MKPKFALRDLFWLVLVAGMGCAWGLDRMQIAKREEAAKLLEERSNSELKLLNEMMLELQKVERATRSEKKP
jgi:hypothetical protein